MENSDPSGAYGVQHSHGPQAMKCPTIGCERGREVICQMIFEDGKRRTESACEKHIQFYVARGVMRHIKLTRGQVGVLAHVDNERRCCA